MRCPARFVAAALARVLYRCPLAEGFVHARCCVEALPATTRSH